MRQRTVIYGLLGLSWPASLSYAQEAPAPAAPPPPNPSGYVTREEYDKLKSQMDSVVQQMAEMKQKQTVSQEEVDRTIEEIEKDIHNNQRAVDQLHLGTNRFMLAGDGSFGFTSQRENNSTFSASFAPLFLYELDKNILFEGALDISGATDDTNNSSTTTDLTLANLTYTVDNNLYVGGGLFAVPFGRYHPHFDPSWINPLPDDPLAFGDRSIAPGSETGFFLGGAVAIQKTQLEYNAYVSNGPNLIVNNSDSAGSLNFDDYTDLNNGKAVGGRLGFLPIPSIDVGYSIQYSNPTPQGFDHDIHALLQAVDGQYKQELAPIVGTLDVQAEWVWSAVDQATYDPTGSQGFGPISFNNNRNGGFVMVAYRPTLVGNKVLKNVEVVVRYDAVNVSKHAPGGGDEDRWTFGLDYWITPSVVLKTAYQVDAKQIGSNQNTFFLQCGFGL